MRLAIETSTDLASVAVSVDGVVEFAEQAAVRKHAEYLLPMIDALLKKMHISISELDGIAFGCGPGSFTGLRIACSLAQGLAFAHDLPLYPMSSLAIIAESVHLSQPQSKSAILSILDARMHQVYWQVFTATGDAITQAVVTDAKDVKSDVQVQLAGVNFTEYLLDNIWLQSLPASVVYPHARVMLSENLWQRTTAVNAEDAVPVYVRNQVVKLGV